MGIRTTAPLLASILVVCLGMAGTSPKSIRAVRAEKVPVLDGKLDDPQWQTAPPVFDFTQSDPVEGKAPTETTSVRILYDDRALYVGVMCYDSNPSGIARQLSRRDRATEADRFTVMIDSYFDRQSAFVFAANVSGVQSDGILTQDGLVFDNGWDAVWSVRTRIRRDGWSAEFEIPFNALRFSERRDRTQRWGINFRRYISRKMETDEWVMVPRSEVLQISHWGYVDGISNIMPPLNLVLSPYVSGTTTFETETADRPRSHDFKALAGLDVKFGLSRNFTLDATINPDFGQVEVDQAVLNLTVFETLYPEKRPFFLEGAQFFTFGSSVDKTPLPLFFSRRIGKRPTGSSSVLVPAGSVLEENPLVTAIMGAAKVSGRSRSGFSLGVLTAATDREDAIVRDTSGVSSSQRTEPAGSYNVVRLKQDFADGSWIGGLGTLVGRRTMVPAFSGGIDWNLRLGEGTHSVDGYFAGARSTASSTNPYGAAGRILFSRISAEHWFYIGSYDFYTRYFNCNDIGFFARPHDHGGYAELLYRENSARGIFRRYGMSLLPEMRWNWDGIRTLAQIEVSASGDFTNFWHATLTYDMKLPAYDDAERGISGIYKRPQAHAVQLQVGSDERKPVSGTFTTQYEMDVRSKRGLASSLNVTVRPSSWVELAPSVFFQRIRREEAGIFANGAILSIPARGTSYSVFADRDVDELDTGLRGIVTFTRTISLQFFSQVLLARGHYRNYRRLVGSTSFVAGIDQSPSYDFNEVTLNANLLLRWEYLPGSTVYLVWTQGRTNDVRDYRTGFSQRFSDAFRLPHEDVLALKLTYCFPF